jgi:hypothetical protein
VPACPKARAKTSSKFLRRLPNLPLGADDDRFSSWGLCLAMLAFVGDAKDGLCGRTLVVSWRIGIRLGVAGASTNTDVLGEVLRRFAGEDSIGRNAGRFYQTAILRRWGIASESTQSCWKDTGK